MLDPLVTTISTLPVITERKPGETDEKQAARHREKVRALLAQAGRGRLLNTANVQYRVGA